MNLKALIIGSHLLYARNGAAAINGAVNGVGGAAVVVASNLKPDTSMPGNWPFAGRVQDCDIKPQMTKNDVMSPSPGAYRRTDQLVSKASLDIDFAVQDVSELFFEMLLLAGGGPIANDFAPMTAVGQVLGWWKLQQYDQGDNLRNVIDVWGYMTVSAQKFDDKPIVAKFSLAVLYNALNSGVLSLA
jgi:hypothetical protein